MDLLNINVMISKVKDEMRQNRQGELEGGATVLTFWVVGKLYCLYYVFFKCRSQHEKSEVSLAHPVKPRVKRLSGQAIIELVRQSGR